VIEPTVQLVYCCNTCGTKDRTVTVRGRRHDESILHWMELVAMTEISRDHSTRQPLCTATKLTSLKIPVNKRDDARPGEAIDPKKPV